MSECFLSGLGQGHVSNFYIVDLVWSGLVVQVVSALLRGNWQDVN